MNLGSRGTRLVQMLQGRRAADSADITTGDERVPGVSAKCGELIGSRLSVDRSTRPVTHDSLDEDGRSLAIRHKWWTNCRPLSQKYEALGEAWL